MSEEPTVDGSTAPDTTVEPAVEPEPLAEGEVIVRLVTEVGDADIRVPAMGKWRASARNALNTRGDDLAWAAVTLSDEDFNAWKDLDPTKDEIESFFEEYGRKSGASNRADRRARQRGNLRAVG